jgi:hypothetical protein
MIVLLETFTLFVSTLLFLVASETPSRRATDSSFLETLREIENWNARAATGGALVSQAEE